MWDRILIKWRDCNRKTIEPIPTRIRNKDPTPPIQINTCWSNRDILWRESGRISSAWTCFPPLSIEIVMFSCCSVCLFVCFFVFFRGGGGSPHSYMLTIYKEHIFKHFHNNLKMCFLHTFPMNLEFTIYYLSLDAFSNVVSTIFCMQRKRILF